MKTGLFTQSEAAERLKIPRRRVYRLIRAGVIKLHGGEGVRGKLAGKVKLRELVLALKSKDRKGRNRDISNPANSCVTRVEQFIKRCGHSPINIARCFIRAAINNADADLLITGVRYLREENQSFLSALCKLDTIRHYRKEMQKISKHLQSLYVRPYKSPKDINPDGLPHGYFTAWAIRDHATLKKVKLPKLQTFEMAWRGLAVKIKNAPINAQPRLSFDGKPLYVPNWYGEYLPQGGPAWAEYSILRPPIISIALRKVLQNKITLDAKLRKTAFKKGIDINSEISRSMAVEQNLFSLLSYRNKSQEYKDNPHPVDDDDDNGRDDDSNKPTLKNKYHFLEDENMRRIALKRLRYFVKKTKRGADYKDLNLILNYMRRMSNKADVKGYYVKKTMRSRISWRALANVFGVSRQRMMKLGKGGEIHEIPKEETIDCPNPKCRKKLKADAMICPYCKHDFTMLDSFNNSFMQCQPGGG